jgi:predicted dehydrogenase
MAIAAGKSVLCEKPIAESVADAEELYAFAKKKGVMLQEGMWYLFRKARPEPLRHCWLRTSRIDQFAV